MQGGSGKPKVIYSGLVDFFYGGNPVKAKTEDRIEYERRSRQDIIMCILRTTEFGSKKTHIISKVRLSSAQATKYLGNLKEAGYISEESRIWKTTKEGLLVINACKMCHSLMNDTFMNDTFMNDR